MEMSFGLLLSSRHMVRNRISMRFRMSCWETERESATTEGDEKWAESTYGHKTGQVRFGEIAELRGSEEKAVSAIAQRLRQQTRVAGDSRRFALVLPDAIASRHCQRHCR